MSEDFAGLHGKYLGRLMKNSGLAFNELRGGSGIKDGNEINIDSWPPRAKVQDRSICFSADVAGPTVFKNDCNFLFEDGAALVQSLNL